MDVEILREIKAMLEQITTLRAERNVIINRQKARQSYFFNVTTTAVQVIFLMIGAIVFIDDIRVKNFIGFGIFAIIVIVGVFLMFAHVLNRWLETIFVKLFSPKRRTDYNQISDIESQIRDRLMTIYENRELVPAEFWYDRTLSQLIFYLNSKQAWSIEEALDLVRIDNQDVRYRRKFENVYENETELLNRLNLQYDYSSKDHHTIERVLFSTHKQKYRLVKSKHKNTSGKAS